MRDNNSLLTFLYKLQYSWRTALFSTRLIFPLCWITLRPWKEKEVGIFFIVVYICYSASNPAFIIFDFVHKKWKEIFKATGAC